MTNVVLSRSARQGSIAEVVPVEKRPSSSDVHTQAMPQVSKLSTTSDNRLWICCRVPSHQRGGQATLDKSLASLVQVLAEKDIICWCWNQFIAFAEPNIASTFESRSAPCYLSLGARANDAGLFFTLSADAWASA